MITLGTCLRRTACVKFEVAGAIKQRGVSVRCSLAADWGNLGQGWHQCHLEAVLSNLLRMWWEGEKDNFG